MDTPRVQGKSAVSIKSVAMPAEHGGWGFLLEPILLGMLVVPSVAGLAISIAAIGFFLLHQPLKIIIKDRQRGRVFARTRLARQFAAGYGAVALVSIIIAFWLAKGVFWLPPLLVIPLIIAQFYFESRNQGRSLWSEIFAAAILASIAPSVILAGGGEASTAALAGLLILLRIPAIIYVRTRIDWLRRKPASIMPALSTHLAAAAITAVLWAGSFTGISALIGTLILLARAIYGLLVRGEKSMKTVGFKELFYGLLYAVLCAFALI
ncbi:MAG: YwiC-like family protein [Anaerolineae bacterium]|nr:YwiC-like family protein [Anaerolineae bacterium]